MLETPFTKITQAFRRQNSLLFVLVPITLVLIAMLFWGAVRIVKQEQARLVLDFSTLVGYAVEQEKFLQQLHDQSLQLPPQAIEPQTTFKEVIHNKNGQERFFIGQQSSVSTSFLWFCTKGEDCPALYSKLFLYGGYVANFYSTFWAKSYFPAPHSYYIASNKEFNIAIPGFGTPDSSVLSDVETFQKATRAVNNYLDNSIHFNCQDIKNHNANDVIWFRTPTLPDKFIGLIPSGVTPYSIGQENCLYAVTVLDPMNISVLERAVYPALKSRFWLQRQKSLWLQHSKYGTLIGEGNIPVTNHQGWRFTPNGVILKVVDDSATWTGYYLISYTSFLRDNQWLPISLISLFLVSLFATLGYTRWYDRRVIRPAHIAQQKIVESEAFNRTLIQTAPIALCLLSRDDGELIFANQLALKWLDNDIGQPFDHSENSKQIISEILSKDSTGMIEQFELSPELTLCITYTPTRYKQRDVILCAFTDVSAHAEIERNLLQAKIAAHEASEAKSLFLATMSHEIRTPLYGALGTLELLSLTHLSTQQRQYVDRIEVASHSLMQLISDILDISKIEAGQLQLNRVEFDPRELVQHCTSTYSAMAHNKGLLLFFVISTQVPSSVWGDPARLKQILNNLISNAIKFTESGYVIVRLSPLKRDEEYCHLLFEVIDSGIGIDKALHEKLFKPFYLIHPNNHSISGAGLGLSICTRLAELMNSKIQLISEPKLGSKFFLKLTFELNTQQVQHPDSPVLTDANILVRSPHPQLTENIIAWLQSWGAFAASTSEQLQGKESEQFLLDIQREPLSSSGSWQGPQLSVPLYSQAEIDCDIDAYSLNSIGFGIERLLHGKPSKSTRIKPLPNFKLRVLVAEDNPLNQITLQEQLERLGCEVSLAGDGEEALALWDISPYDIIFTDVNMPYMNGYQFASKLREEGVKAVIIGLTANAMQDEEKRCIEAGMNAWLVKPIELRELAEILHKMTEVEGSFAISEKEADLEFLEPNVLIKHRIIFIKTMEEDLQHLEHGIAIRNAHIVDMVLHRMRGALVLANKHEMALAMETLEQHIKTVGLDEDAIARIAAIMSEIRQLLSHIAI